ncbi:hypothetical protein [Vreelandella populi]|uniref:Uncharacterized protein n=1 Tax=Vreelandella populi TaxID=2498858 RepID=A0A433LG59_9GAMM|nr:hypothetical protein [Halomonas populi]RUR48817.1 hypothetical protein ELY37_02905 [Halomonas populi]
MKWKLKDKANDRAIISDCGRYQISRFTCGGNDLYLIYQGGTEIGSADNGNQARQVAEKHKAKGAA